MSIYSIFIPFLQNLSTMQAYNTAYYWAIAGTERALLVTRQQWFWFDGSWWRQGETNRWPISDHRTSDMNSLSEEDNGISRTIQWSTNRIPDLEQWNIPKAFSSIDSKNYNTFKAADTLKIRLETNNNTDKDTFYSSDSKIVVKFTWEEIQSHRRIPTKIKEDLGNSNNTLLCDSETNILCDTNQDWVSDDIIIARQREGMSNGKTFIITPVSKNTNSGGDITIDYQQDSHIRESIINNDGITPFIPIVKFNNTMNPIQKTTLTSTIDNHNTIWPWWEEIQTSTFSSLLSNPSISWLAIRYDMIQDATNRNWYVYPFLEWYIQADQKFSNTDRHITGIWRSWPYNINIYVQRPQWWNTQWGNFTIVF